MLAWDGLDPVPIRFLWAAVNSAVPSKMVAFVDLLVDGLLRGSGVQARDSGQEADVIVDEGLTGHGELLSVGFQLALRQQLGSRSIRLDLAVLRYLQEITHATDHVLMVCSGFEVRQGSLRGNLLEGGRYTVVQIHDGLADRLIHDGREGRGRVVELSAQLRIQIIGTHADQLARGAVAVTGQALDGQITQAHASELVCSVCRLRHRHAGAHGQAVHRSSAELVLCGIGHDRSAGQRSVVGTHVLNHCSAYLLYSAVVIDEGARLHTELRAQVSDLTDALTLRSNCPLGIVLVAVRAVLCMGGLLSLLISVASISAASIGLCGPVKGFQRTLQAVELGSFICRHRSAFGLRKLQQFTLASEDLFSTHGGCLLL